MSPFPLRGAVVLAWLLLATLNVQGGWTLKTIHTFDAEDSYLYSGDGQPDVHANGSLVTDNSFLYGTTQNGGEGQGSVYALSFNGDLYVILKSFGASTDLYDGLNPGSGLVISPDFTTLYGTTKFGGLFGTGTVFAYDLSGHFRILFDFDALDNCRHNTDGAAPTGILALTVTPYITNLYGTTSTGGISGCDPVGGSGTVFGMTLDWYGQNPAFSPLHTFTYNSPYNFENSDGANPQAGLVKGSFNGNLCLFGTTSSSGPNGFGTLFRLNILDNNNQLVTLHSFPSFADDGAIPTDFQDQSPTPNLVLSGVWLYGTTLDGGTNNLGTVFKIKIDGSGYKILHSFNSIEGSANSLVMADNVLYGTGNDGGAYGGGMVFSLLTDGSNFSLLYSFPAPGPGANNSQAYPSGGLLWCNGAFYGTTTGGENGYDGLGTVFQLTYQPNFRAQFVPGPGIPKILINHDPPPGAHHFMLQSAPAMDAVFTTIVGATNPYTNIITEPQRFFKLVLDTNTPPGAPDVATLPATSLVGNGASLNGSIVPNGADTAAWFKYGTTTNYGQTTTNTLVGAANTNAVDVSIIISGLAPGTLYHFQAMGSNGVGIDMGGDFTFTSPSPPTVVTLAATGTTPTGATLNGSVTPNGADTTYWFAFGLDTNYTGGSTSSGLVSASNTNAVNVNSPINGLTPGTLYHFQLIGTNSAGANFGGDLTFTTPVPPIVSTPAATSVTTTTAVLNGTISGNGSQAVAHFQYGTDTNYTGGQVGTYFTSAPGDTEPFNFTLAGLTPNTTYHYRAFGFNCCAEGFGADATFTTVWAPVPPTLISPGASTPSGPTLATLTPLLTWSAAAQASSSDLSISQSPYGAGNVVFTAGVSGSSFTIPDGFLQPGTAYAWYMVSFNSLGDESAASPSLYFQTPSAPSAQTVMATNLTSSSALLTGSVNPNGLSTTVYFQFGVTTNYGSVTATNTINGASAQIVSQTTGNGLSAKNNPYHFRVVATNSLGATNGADVQFSLP